VVSVPADFKNILEQGGTMSDFYIEHLVVDKQIVNMLKVEKITLEREIAAQRSAFEKARQELEAAHEAHRIQMLKDQAALKKQLDEQRAALAAAQKAKS
jgi:hypothetical protein